MSDSQSQSSSNFKEKTLKTILKNQLKARKRKKTRNKYLKYIATPLLKVMLSGQPEPQRTTTHAKQKKLKISQQPGSQGTGTAKKSILQRKENKQKNNLESQKIGVPTTKTSKQQGSKGTSKSKFQQLRQLLLNKQKTKLRNEIQKLRSQLDKKQKQKQMIEQKKVIGQITRQQKQQLDKKLNEEIDNIKKKLNTQEITLDAKTLTQDDLKISGRIPTKQDVEKYQKQIEKLDLKIKEKEDNMHRKSKRNQQITDQEHDKRKQLLNEREIFTKLIKRYRLSRIANKKYIASEEVVNEFVSFSANIEKVINILALKLVKNNKRLSKDLPFYIEIDFEDEFDGEADGEIVNNLGYKLFKLYKKHLIETIEDKLTDSNNVMKNIFDLKGKLVDEIDEIVKLLNSLDDYDFYHNLNIYTISDEFHKKYNRKLGMYTKTELENILNKITIIGGDDDEMLEDQDVKEYKYLIDILTTLLNIYNNVIQLHDIMEEWNNDTNKEEIEENINLLLENLNYMPYRKSNQQNEFSFKGLDLNDVDVLLDDNLKDSYSYIKYILNEFYENSEESLKSQNKFKNDPLIEKKSIYFLLKNFDFNDDIREKFLHVTTSLLGQVEQQQQQTQKRSQKQSTQKRRKCAPRIYDIDNDVNANREYQSIIKDYPDSKAHTTKGIEIKGGIKTSSFSNNYNWAPQDLCLTEKERNEAIDLNKQIKKKKVDKKELDDFFERIRDKYGDGFYESKPKNVTASSGKRGRKPKLKNTQISTGQQQQGQSDNQSR